jgi:hypothetical protein
MNAEELLLQGKEILDPALEPWASQFRATEAGHGSGGHLAVGVYTHGEWSIELHVRWTLGIVNYKFGEATLEHRYFMQLLCVERQAMYPGFSDDPLDAFRHLRSDLERFAEPFLRRADAEQFKAFAQSHTQDSSARRRLP